MEMFDPPHPGEIVREDCIKASGFTVTAAATALGVSRQSVSELVNRRNRLSADMAVRLEKAGWGSAEAWLRSQAAYDLQQARSRAEPPARIKVKRKSSKPATTAAEVTARKAAARKAALKKARADAAKRPQPSKKCA